jgi:hypothetical protein
LFTFRELKIPLVVVDWVDGTLNICFDNRTIVIVNALGLAEIVSRSVDAARASLSLWKGRQRLPHSLANISGKWNST